MKQSSQVEEIAASHRKNKNVNSSDEFLSGFKKDDKLHPVITLVIFWSPDKWDGPRTLHDMLDISDTEYLAYVSDYKLNIVAPEEIENDDFGKLHTSLSEVLQYVKYSKNISILEEVMNQNERFRHLDRKSAELINVVTNSNLKYDEGNEVVDMCKAINDLVENSKNEAREEMAKELISDGAYSFGVYLYFHT